MYVCACVQHNISGTYGPSYLISMSWENIFLILHKVKFGLFSFFFLKGQTLQKSRLLLVGMMMLMVHTVVHHVRPKEADTLKHYIAAKHGNGSNSLGIKIIPNGKPSKQPTPNTNPPKGRHIR